MRQIPAGLTLLAATFAAAPFSSSASQQVTAFTNVNVIPMDRERVLEDQTVIVRDGRIAQIGPSRSTRVPDGARLVDGNGRYLIPGLAEMHAHIPPPRIQRFNLGRQWVEDVLFLYVANGVTTVRGMLGDPSHLRLREQVETGDVVGPRIWTSGPSVNGNSVQTPDSALRTPEFQQDAGYDFIKIHPGLTRETFDSLDAAADRVGIGFSGHVPAAVGIRRALEARYSSIDHLDRYLEYLAGNEHASGQVSGFFGANLVDDIDESRIREIARRTREAGVWNTPTQTLMDSYVTEESPESMARRPEIRYMPPGMRRSWMDWKRNRSSQGPSQPQRNRFTEIRHRLIRALQDEGAGLLLGSDAPQVWNVPGFSAHRELQSIVAAGLTPYEALITGTRNVATFFGIEDRAGTIAVGKYADLILLEANPLTDITTTTRRAGVMLRGRWMSQQWIQDRLERIAARYAQ